MTFEQFFQLAIMMFALPVTIYSYVIYKNVNTYSAIGDNITRMAIVAFVIIIWTVVLTWLADGWIVCFVLGA
jgi:hypothetical protein